MKKFKVGDLIKAQKCKSYIYQVTKIEFGNYELELILSYKETAYPTGVLRFAHIEFFSKCKDRDLMSIMCNLLKNHLIKNYEENL